MHRILIIGALAAFGPLAAGGGTQSSEASSAEEVFARFCQLDSQGGQLTPDGWRKIATLFVSPGISRRDKILVTDRGDQLRPTPEGAKIGVGREYILYGQIELPRLRFSAVNGLPPGAKILDEGYDLVNVSGPGGSAEWRIEGPVPQPHLTVDAAIRYVTEARTNAADAGIKKNADQTLAILKRFR